VLVLDFCCVFETAAATLESMFRDGVLDAVFVMVVTFTHRDNSRKIPNTYYNADEANHKIVNMAHDYGYILSQQKNEYTNGTHFTLYYKGMKTGDVMGKHVPASSYSKKKVRHWFVQDDPFFKTPPTSHPLKKPRHRSAVGGVRGAPAPDVSLMTEKEFFKWSTINI